MQALTNPIFLVNGPASPGLRGEIVPPPARPVGQSRLSRAPRALRFLVRPSAVRAGARTRFRFRVTALRWSATVAGARGGTCGARGARHLRRVDPHHGLARRCDVRRALPRAGITDRPRDQARVPLHRGPHLRPRPVGRASGTWQAPIHGVTARAVEPGGGPASTGTTLQSSLGRRLTARTLSGEAGANAVPRVAAVVAPAAAPLRAGLRRVGPGRGVAAGTAQDDAVDGHGTRGRAGGRGRGQAEVGDAQLGGAARCAPGSISSSANPYGYCSSRRADQVTSSRPVGAADASW